MRRPLVEIVVASTLCCGGLSAMAQGADGTASAASAPGDASPADRERLKTLEERIERLRLEQTAARQAIEQLQARAAEATNARPRAQDPVLLALGIAVPLLLGVIALLAWRLARHRGEQAWLDEARSLTGPAPAPAPEAPRPSASISPGLDEATMTSMRVAPPPAAMDPPEDPHAVTAVPSTTIPQAARLRRELTPEELIDLEQQADFFIAIGQEESALDLLMAHVRSSGGTSPMPYLKLLAIYRRRGEAHAYERIRDRFNRRFNAHAPAWESDPARGRPLEDYPEVVQRVQRAWPASPRAADLLEALLFRRDPTQAGFDLPAYEELLFLYALAKDLIAHESNPHGVDLLLPLDEPAPAPITQMSAPRTAVGVRSRVDVDIDLDLGGPRA